MALTFDSKQILAAIQQSNPNSQQLKQLSAGLNLLISQVETAEKQAQQPAQQAQPVQQAPAPAPAQPAPAPAPVQRASIRTDKLCSAKKVKSKIK